MPINNINWITIFEELTNKLEVRYDLDLMVDVVVLEEVGAMAKSTLDSLNMDSTPNVAKTAGHVSFWIRKLKPISHAEKSNSHFTAINELAGLLVGLAICTRYFDDTVKENITMNNRILFDWVNSMRLNSHSPSSTSISFEMLALP